MSFYPSTLSINSHPPWKVYNAENWESLICFLLVYQDKTLGKLRSNSINSDIQRLEVKLHLVREALGRLKFQKDKYFSPFTGSKNPEAGSIAVGGGQNTLQDLFAFRFVQVPCRKSKHEWVGVEASQSRPPTHIFIRRNHHLAVFVSTAYPPGSHAPNILSCVLGVDSHPLNCQTLNSIP